MAQSNVKAWSTATMQRQEGKQTFWQTCSEGEKYHIASESRWLNNCWSELWEYQVEIQGVRKN